MKFTLSWLKDHLETNATLDEIATALTQIGLEVESVEDKQALYAPFVIAEVLDAQPHPDADRLKVCTVSTGSDTVQVVCGAPNARTGMRAVFAPEKSWIPGLDVTLKKSKIRGVESNGMMVSEKELLLSEAHNGIIDLPDDAPVGQSYAAYAGLDDAVIDIAITPNRGDCAGIRGIARDLAAFGLGRLKPLKETSLKVVTSLKPSVSLEFSEDTQDACPYFIARHIGNVKNGPSPDWLQRRLKAVGLRPISALVDITNYISLDLCRPLHVFDADKIKGDLHVRLAKAGETFLALDEEEYTMTGEETVICDESGIVALAGVMGGLNSGVQEDTKNVILEVAYFDPYRTAKTGRLHQIDSDARYRFERGVDPGFLTDATEIATQMILDLCGGEAGPSNVAGAQPRPLAPFTYSSARAEKVLGVAIPPARQKEILTALGFSVSENWEIGVPSWRHDIEGPADIVEEVGRIFGYDNITNISVHAGPATKPAENIKRKNMRLARTALAGAGFLECVTWSFMGEALADQFEQDGSGTQKAQLTLTNPISNDLIRMRPSILPNLLQAAARNAARGFGNAMIFEVGPVFTSANSDGYTVVASALREGHQADKHWSGPEASRPFDLYDARQDALNILEACGAPTGNLQIMREAPSFYHPGRSGVLKLGKTVLATFGELHPLIIEAENLKGPVVACEVFFERIPLPKAKGTARPLLQLSSLQPVHRDFAFIVDRNVDADAILKAVRGSDRNLITEAGIFDVFTGESIGLDKKSVAVRITIQPDQLTLTDSDLEAIMRKVTDSVENRTGASLRA